MLVPLRYNFKIRQYLLKVQNSQRKRIHIKFPATLKPTLLVPPPRTRSPMGFFLSPFSPWSASALGVVGVRCGNLQNGREELQKEKSLWWGATRIPESPAGAGSWMGPITPLGRMWALAGSWPPFRRSLIRLQEVGPRPSG